MNIWGYDVSFELGNKIYILNNNSSTGKTYLYSMLQSYNLLQPTDYFLLETFSNNINKNDIIDKIRTFNGNIIFFDRFDMYYDEDIISELYNKNIPVMLDLKDYRKANTFNCRPAMIHFTKDVMKVVGL